MNQEKHSHTITPAVPLPTSVTRLLCKWAEGDRAALDQLMPLMYGHLREEAQRHMHNLHVRGYTLQPTVLVNEVYLKLVDKKDLSFSDREQFLWFAGNIIRHLIVDHIRAKLRLKRKPEELVSLDNQKNLLQSLATGKWEPSVFLTLDHLITKLKSKSPRGYQIVLLRFFAGANIKETARILEVSPTTVKEEWAQAKFWFFQQLSPPAIQES